MKDRIIVLIIFFLFTQIVWGQNTCSCETSLQNLIQKIENEYPGFQDKTKDKIVYSSFKKQVTDEAARTKASECLDLLKKYISFFRDGHVRINRAISVNSEGNVHTDFVNVNSTKFQKKIKSGKDPLEGIWKNRFEWTGGTSYEIGLTKTNKDEYTGFIITSTSKFWEPKETKFKLFSDGKYELYFANKTLDKGNYEIYNDNIIYFKEARASFIKETPKPNLTEEQIKRKIGELYGFEIKQLTPKTAIITLPSFDYPYVEIIEGLINNNRSLLENSENLIVDLRGNSGGTDNAYQKLLPYIMTNSIRNMGVEFLATQTLIDGLEGYIKTVKDKKENESEIKMLRESIELYEKNLLKFVNTSDSTFSIQEIEMVKKSPKNIVVLTDNRVGSSGENFVMKAKQSKKVKIMGRVTSGGLDYASARFFDFACPEYRLLLPTHRSLRLPDYPIDNIGLQPDIYLDNSVENWVQFAVRYVESQ